MIRYVMAAVGLKLFSLNRVTKSAYRYIGNRKGGPLRRKKAYIQSHMSRSDLFRNLVDKYGLNQGENQFLEIGTGWVHWHSVYHNIFYDDKISMLDIWDCRNFSAFKELFNALRIECNKQGLVLTRDAEDRLDIVCSVTSFEELYEKLNLSYYVEKTGSIARFPDNSLDCVFSFHVLEHVPKEYTEGLVENIYRSLKPGGYSIHQIGIDDHLAHYDASESPKKYICYSDAVWKKLFENNIQYFNRMQMSEWIDLFEQKGMKFIDKIPVYCDISNIEVHPRFQGYSDEDLKCTTLTIIHQKEVN